MALYEIWKARRAEQQVACDRMALQVSHGYTGVVELPAVLVSTWRRDWAERISEAESEREPLPERESFDQWLRAVVSAFRSEIPHGFAGANGWGRCVECDGVREDEQHSTEGI